MLHAADRLHPSRVLEAGKVEEPEQVLVADVEEKMVRTRIIPVLYQFDQREPEKLLVELDRFFRVAADQREMVHAMNGRRRPAGGRPQVLLAQLPPALANLLEFFAFWLWHD